jgi:glycerol kinase
MTIIRYSLSFFSSVKPSNIEATAFGAAFAAGVAVGVYSLDQFAWDDTLEAESYQPQMEQNEREMKFEGWKKAVTKSFNL